MRPAVAEVHPTPRPSYTTLPDATLGGQVLVLSLADLVDHRGYDRHGVLTGLPRRAVGLLAFGHAAIELGGAE
jgi:hypothetical protein